MALSTYSGLVASINNWIHRPDLGDLIPDVIGLVESSVNNGHLFREQETLVTLSNTIGNNYITLPTDYISTVSVKLDNANRPALELISFETLNEYNISGGYSGQAEFYSIVGNKMYFSPSIESSNPAIAFDLIYYAKIPPLTSGNPTNWLLQKAPGVYLYGALFELCAFTMDDERIQMFKAKFDEAMAQLKQARMNEKFSGSSIRSRSSYTV